MLRLCANCKSPIGRGLAHKCNLTTYRSNLLGFCDQADSDSKEIVASKIVRERVDLEKSKNIELNTRGPRAMRVSVDFEPSFSQFSSKDASNMQINLGASNSSMIKKIIPTIRNAFGRESVEKNTDEYLYARDKQLDDLFSLTYLEFEGNQTSSRSPVVYCHDLGTLVDRILEARNISRSDARVKLGIDAGGGYLKFCMSIFDCVSRFVTESRRLIEKGFSDTGVKKIMIIAISPDTKETYNNVKLLFDLLHTNEIPIRSFYSVDLKMANIICGLQSHGCTYPCAWCRCPSGEFSSDRSRSYPVRTIGDIKRNAFDFAASQKKSAKEFESSIHEPLFLAADNDILFRHVVLPELHLLLRVTNKLMHELESKNPLSFEIWIDRLGITRPKLHSGEFNGNMCRKILNNVTCLRDIIEEHDEHDSLGPFADTFDSLNQVRVSCFGDNLTDDYETKLIRFREHYMKLNISVSTSVHVVFNHLIQFIRYQKSSLGVFSEQAAECVHSDFMKLWQSCKIDQNNDKYARYLFDATVRYNGRHFSV